ncbi:hypothetical protein CYMTET_10401 [Cymbomonas tetramitiformis]|uniref:ARMET C-terminal domain-containing protein n=1 Tax=Cymbomonas tetramitiformis TaxID=36881 RepID=A0AAE0GP88_9CHLO|nr:hypothetical protein CYMTET_10401 [Cymbomonas tetramitiformis]
MTRFACAFSTVTIFIAVSVAETDENVAIDAWLASSDLNEYGDPHETAYAGGNPLFDMSTGESIDRYQHIKAKFPDSPWSTAEAAKKELPNFRKMRVKELRKLLDERGVECKACGEKDDLVQRISETYHLPLTEKPDTKDSRYEPKEIPTDAPNYEDIMRQFKQQETGGTPRQRELLEKLRAKGMSISGAANMDEKMLENLVNAMESDSFKMSHPKDDL